MVKTVAENKVKKNESKSKKVVLEETPVVVEEVKPVTQEPISLQNQPIVENVKIEDNEISVVETVVEESNTELLFNKLINQFQDVQSVMKTLHSNLKILQKEVLREKKESKKKESKIKKKSDKKKSPSGFAKPTPITNDLSNFLNIPNGEEIARTDVTSKVIAYVKLHNLQNPENKKQIIPDDNLGKILQSGSDVVTFFNLQTYLKKHFLPPVQVTAVAV
jgi:chromatin remodeling complex protein RSC6